MTSPIVNDVTGLNPVSVRAILTPKTVAEVIGAIRDSRGPVSIGGGYFSMGGQTASPGSLHFDMRQLNQVVSFDPGRKRIRVQAGIRWSDIQRHIDAHGLAIKVMQTYANFTVGGALSVNCHGRYIGLGPVILSVCEIAVVSADGTLVTASRETNRDIFFGAIGGYGGIGIIVEAELELTDNIRVARDAKKVVLRDYHDYFRDAVRNKQDAVFHNGDIYPPHYNAVLAQTWRATEQPATHHERLQAANKNYHAKRYAMWAVTETRTGKWRRERIYEPLIYSKRPVHWRNFEAGYDVAELEPRSRARSTYVLQEYFVPVGRLEQAVTAIGKILRLHRANVVNISIRHAYADPGSLLAWAREECFALVLYYKQNTSAAAKSRVAIWTRELIDAVLAEGGSYYLPYQPHATVAQFHAAYPRADEYFALKARLDPEFRFRNALWNKYYQPPASSEAPPYATTARSDFATIYGDERARDSFFSFLQNIFHLYPEERLHALIEGAQAEGGDDEAIYRRIQAGLASIRPPLSDLRFGIPALIKQKREIATETLALLGERRGLRGYVEIGSTGRYVQGVRSRLDSAAAITLINEIAPTNAPPDILERGRLQKVGRFVPLADYMPLAADRIADESVDLVTCYIGLHHCAPDRLPAFLASIRRILRPGGMFILRDHDVTSPEMDSFVGLAHTVFNAGLGATWEINKAEPRYFAPIAAWSERLSAAGFVDGGHRIAQPGDPTRNLLMDFIRP